MITAEHTIQKLLSEPTITDLCFNRYNDAYVDQGQGMQASTHASSIFQNEIEYRNFVLEQLSKSGRTWDAKLPFVDTVFFSSHRAHLSFPPLAQHGIYLCLRRLPVKNSHILPPDQAHAEAFARWSGSASYFQTLVSAVMNHKTILIAGGTGCGKTTLLNDLLSFCSPLERIIALEDTAEISPQHPQFLGLLSRPANADGMGTVTLRDLLRQTLRMRPDRIILGECRGDEVLDLLQTLNTGHQGTLCTLHANHARDALRRLELLALIGAKGVLSSSLVRELIAGGIQYVAYLEREKTAQGQGPRSIQSLVKLEGREGDTLLIRPINP